MGTGKIEVVDLQKTGVLQCKIILEKEDMGSMTCDYELKAVPVPVLTLKNISCTILSKPTFILASVLFHSYLETPPKHFLRRGNLKNFCSQRRKQI